MSVYNRPWYYPYNSPEEKKLRDRWVNAERILMESYVKCIQRETSWEGYKVLRKLRDEVKSEFKKAQREANGFDIEICASIANTIH
jgi:hypothetical protein